MTFDPGDLFWLGWTLGLLMGAAFMAGVLLAAERRRWRRRERR